LRGIAVDFYSVFWYLSIFVAIQCVFIWKLVFLLVPNRKEHASSSFVARLSQLTFGVYLIHYFIIRELLWNWTPIQDIHPYIFQTGVIILLAIIGSFALSGVIASLPGARFLIGVEFPFRKTHDSA
jgi:surface polysaccharide O-acyltransferase-like enzyme